jgi:hypothetical protein
MECFGATDFDNNSWLITLSAIIISGLHCTCFCRAEMVTRTRINVYCLVSLLLCQFNDDSLQFQNTLALMSYVQVLDLSLKIMWLNTRFPAYRFLFLLHSVFSLPVNSLKVQQYGFKCKRVGINLIPAGVTRGCKGPTVCLILVRRQRNLRYSLPVGPDDYLAHSHCNCIQTREDRISGRTKIGWYVDSGTRRGASQPEWSNRAKPC